MDKMIMHRRPGRPDSSPFVGLDRWFDEAFQGLTERAGTGLVMDVLETDDAYTVEVEAPGVRRDEIDLTLERNQLTVTVDKVEEASDEGRRYLRRERMSTAAARTIRFPQRVDADQVKAEFADGVLTVTVPKVADERARKIDIG
ncbi:MAG: Hsp20/alpha crystallin family protein [Actinomycetota bacterium]